MDLEKVLGLVLTIVITMLSWWVKTVWADLRATKEKVDKLELHVAQTYVPKTTIDKAQDEVLAQLARLSSLEVLLAKQYVTKAELKELFAGVATTLERIDGKLDKKQDK